MNYTRHCVLGLAFVSTVWLSACGGGGAAEPLVVGSDVPVSATQNARAATAFVRTVAADESENGDALQIDAAELATSETDEAEPDN